VSLEGKRVVVTGAASGIGRSMAELFAAEGAAVVAADLDREGLDSLCAEHPSITVVTADGAVEADVDRVVSAAGDVVDVLCNNAGLMDRFLLAEEIDPAEWDRVLAVNLTAPYLFCRRVLPGMVARGDGRVVNTASIAGIRGGRAGAAYTASKHGLVGLTRNIAVTYGPSGIRCNAICPGRTRGGAKGAHAPGAEMSERGVAIISGRDARPPTTLVAAEIARVAVFLAGEGGTGINGAELVVDAGATAF
jgi:NAD(P)-dependent dehydrogenase (short-subunit alcohol dehydrogenase family)